MTTPLEPGVFVNVSQSPLAQSVSNIPGEGQAAFAALYNRGPVNPVQVTSWPQFVKLFGSFSQAGGNSMFHQSVYQFFANGGSSCFCVRVPNTDAVVATLTVQDIAGSPVNLLTFTATSKGAWGNTVYVNLVAAGPTGQGRFNVQVYVGGTAQANLMETFPSLSVNPLDSRNIVSVLNSPYAGSQYVSVSFPTGSPLAPGGSGYVLGSTDPNVSGGATALASGSDGSTAPTNLGSSVSAAFDQLQDQILYVNIPGDNTAADINALLGWADTRGDVMVVVDGPTPSAGETSANVRAAYITMVSGSGVNADANAVLYAPYLLVLDPSSAVSGATRLVPPGGAVLGVWQRGMNQYGVQQAPAGTWATLNVQGLEVNFTATDLQDLNNVNVNAIKAVPNTGFCVFGARTLAVGVPSRYVNIQRSLIQLSHDMENLLAYATFEPNNSSLWQSITSVLTAYLTTQMQDGMFAGSTPASAFSVTCDASNNTPTSVGSGVVNVTVGVALSAPAEFIYINLQQLSASASV